MDRQTECKTMNSAGQPTMVKANNGSQPVTLLGKNSHMIWYTPPRMSQCRPSILIINTQILLKLIALHLSDDTHLPCQEHTNFSSALKLTWCYFDAGNIHKMSRKPQWCFGDTCCQQSSKPLLASDLKLLQRVWSGELLVSGETLIFRLDWYFGKVTISCRLVDWLGLHRKHYQFIYFIFLIHVMKLWKLW